MKKLINLKYYIENHYQNLSEHKKYVIYSNIYVYSIIFCADNENCKKKNTVKKKRKSSVVPIITFCFRFK